MGTCLSSVSTEERLRITTLIITMCTTKELLKKKVHLISLISFEENDNRLQVQKYLTFYSESFFILSFTHL